MKRVRPSASIEEWVACTVALAVKCQRIRELEAELAKAERLVERYDTILENIKPDEYFCCLECNEWHEDIDKANCENGCTPSCQDCEDRTFCSICNGLFCSDCIWRCPKLDCSYVGCVNCGNSKKHACPKK